MNGPELLDLGMHAAQLTAQIWATVHAANVGAIKAEDALAHIGTLHDALLAQRDATDKALAKKFDTSEETTKP